MQPSRRPTTSSTGSPSVAATSAIVSPGADGREPAAGSLDQDDPGLRHQSAADSGHALRLDRHAGERGRDIGGDGQVEAVGIHVRHGRMLGRTGGDQGGIVAATVRLPALGAGRDRLHPDRRPPGGGRAPSRPQVTRVLPAPVSVPAMNRPCDAIALQLPRARTLRLDTGTCTSPPRSDSPAAAGAEGRTMDDLPRWRECRARRGAARSSRSCARGASRPVRPRLRAAAALRAPMALSSCISARTRGNGARGVRRPAPARRAARAAARCRQSCMSAKTLTCGARVHRRPGRAQFLQRVRPEGAGQQQSAGLEHARALGEALSGRSPHCSIRLLKTRSTLPLRSGSACASAQTQPKRRHGHCRRRAARSMPGAISSAITRAPRKRRASSAVAAPVPAPRSSTTAGARRK